MEQQGINRGRVQSLDSDARGGLLRLLLRHPGNRIDQRRRRPENRVRAQGPLLDAAQSLEVLCLCVMVELDGLKNGRIFAQVERQSSEIRADSNAPDGSPG